MLQRKAHSTTLTRGTGKEVAVCGRHRMIPSGNEARAAAPMLITASLGVTSGHDLQAESDAGGLRTQVNFVLISAIFICVAYLYLVRIRELIVRAEVNRNQSFQSMFWMI